MNKKDVVAVESFDFGQEPCGVPLYLIDSLYDFLSNFYHLANQQEFINLVIQPNLEGELSVLFGMNGVIAGLSRTTKQHLTLGKKEITVFTALMYLDSSYKPYPMIANVGLSQGMAYKLAHPREEIAYIAFANSPFNYKLVAKLSDCLYPKPFQAVPNQILSIVEAVKKHNGWISTGPNPMIVHSPLVPIRAQVNHLAQEHEELEEFYLETNPDYMQGKALLTYIPLNLANINYGLKIVTQKPVHAGIILNHEGHNQDKPRLWM